MSKTILLAEDDPFIIDIYSSQLRREGYHVELANDGQMVLDKIKNHIPDLLFLDINLPKLSGWEILKILRDNATTKSLKVIVLTNISPSEYPANFEDFKVARYFLKVETSMDDVVKAVKEILK